MLLTLLPALVAAPTFTAPGSGADSIQWHQGTIFSALQEAGNAQTHALVYFWSNGSQQCATMYGETMAEDSVIDSMGDFVCFSADTADPAGYKLVEKYGVSTLPTVLFIKPGGVLDDAIVGSIDGDGFVTEMQRVVAGTDTISDFKRRAEAAPQDLALQYAYAVKLQDCFDAQGYAEVTGRIKAADPKMADPVTAGLVFSDMQRDINNVVYASGDPNFAAADLEPLLAFLHEVKHDKVKRNGLGWVAYVAREKHDVDTMTDAYEVVWKLTEEGEAGEFGRSVVNSYFELREDLDRSDKSFIMKVATASMEDFERKVAEMQASEDKGCASYHGCAEGDEEGCGGCEGTQGEVAAWRAEVLDTLACGYFLNGKRSKAVAAIEEALAMVPEHEGLKARLATFQNS